MNNRVERVDVIKFHKIDNLEVRCSLYHIDYII